MDDIMSSDVPASANQENRGRAFEKNTGMALVEVLFALGILVVTLSFLVGSLISFNRLATVTEQRERAAVRMSSYLDGLRHAAPGEIVAGSFQPALVPENGEVWQVHCQTADGNYLPIPIDTSTLSSPLTAPLTVRVTVTRKDVHGVPIKLSSGVICQ